jgi:hypothetical protein
MNSHELDYRLAVEISTKVDRACEDPIWGNIYDKVKFSETHFEDILDEIEHKLDGRR